MKKYRLEIAAIVAIAVGVFIGFCFAFYELERAKAKVLCRIKLEKDVCEEILK